MKRLINSCFFAILLVSSTLFFISCSDTNANSTDSTISGECPKCGSKVNGYMVMWDGEDSEGNPVSGVEYRAECPNCKAELYSLEYYRQGIKKVKWTIFEKNEEEVK